MTEQQISFVYVRPEDGCSSLDQHNNAFSAGDTAVLTAQESQVYDKVMKVVKEKEALNRSMQENYQKLLVNNFIEFFFLYFYLLYN